MEPTEFYRKGDWKPIGLCLILIGIHLFILVVVFTAIRNSETEEKLITQSNMIVVVLPCKCDIMNHQQR